VKSGSEIVASAACSYSLLLSILRLGRRRIDEKKGESMRILYPLAMLIDGYDMIAASLRSRHVLERVWQSWQNKS
jgi:hypothetical protein